MEMTMLLLVSAAALLVSPAFASPVRHDNLDRIIELSRKYNDSFTKGPFVEDVKHLVDAGCENVIFCKVHQILHDHQEFNKNKHGKELLENLSTYINITNINCTKMLEEVTKTGISRPILYLLNNLTSCIKQRNFRGPKSHNS